MDFDSYTTSEPAVVKDPAAVTDLLARYVFEPMLTVGCRRLSDGKYCVEAFGASAPAATEKRSSAEHQIVAAWRFDPQRAWAVFVTDEDELLVQSIDDHSELAGGVRPMNDSEAVLAARAAGLRVGDAANVLDADGQPMWLDSVDCCRDDFEQFLLDLAPLLAEEFIVQYVGREGLRFPFAAWQAVVQPDAKELVTNGF